MLSLLSKGALVVISALGRFTVLLGLILELLRVLGASICNVAEILFYYYLNCPILRLDSNDVRMDSTNIAVPHSI